MELLVQNTSHVEIQNAREIKQYVHVSIIVLKLMMCDARGQSLSNWYGGNEHAVITRCGCTMLRVVVGQLSSTHCMSKPDWQKSDMSATCRQHVINMSAKIPAKLEWCSRLGRYFPYIE